MVANLTDEQLAIRRSRVGASEVAAICGQSKWGGPHSVWLDKMGLAEPSPDTVDTEWGKRQEAVIRQWYADLTHQQVEPGATLVHPTIDWVCATPDAFVRDAHGQIVKTIQIKTARYPHGWGDSGTHDFPAFHYCQLMWEMFVAGVKKCDLVVLIDNVRVPYIYPDIPFDPHLFASLFDAVSLWRDDYLLTGIEPPVDGSRDSTARLAARFPAHKGDNYLWSDSPADAALAEEYVAAKQAAADADDRLAAVKNRLADRIAEHPGMEGAWGRVTYKAAMRSTLDKAALYASRGITQADIDAHSTKQPIARSMRVTLK